LSGPKVHDDVKRAVLAWARAEDFTASASILKQARERLAPELLPELRSEVAAVSAETLLRVMALESRPGSESRVEVEGVPLDDHMLERLSAWREDQIGTADALGLEVDQWTRLIQAALSTTILPEGQAADEVAAERIAAAKKLIQADPSSFQNPDRKSSGVAGLIGAMRFPTKKH